MTQDNNPKMWPYQHAPTKSDAPSVEKDLLRVLMTAPNNMQEITLNGRHLTVFEVQNYTLILDLIKTSNLALLEQLEGKVEQLVNTAAREAMYEAIHSIKERIGVRHD